MRGSGSVTHIDGPAPPDDTLADLLTLDPDTGTVLYDRSAFRWLTAGQHVVYTIAFQAQSNDDAPQTKTLTVTINGLNDAPVLATPNHQTFAAMAEDDAPGAARTVASFRGSITDGDPGALTGIAITATAGLGDWQYSIDDGGDLAAFTASSAQALLLRDTDLLRFAPDGKNGGQASFTYHAWDQTSGDAGSFADTSVTGGRQRVQHRERRGHAAGCVDQRRAGDDAGPHGARSDHRGRRRPMPASRSGPSCATRSATWTTAPCRASRCPAPPMATATGSIRVDGGATWLAVGTRSESAALLLRHDDCMRFVPDGNNGTVRDLDLSCVGSDHRRGRRLVDLSGGNATGGTTAYSTATDTVSIAVSDVNDAPTLSGPVTLAAVAEDSGTRLITQARAARRTRPMWIPATR